MLAGASLATIGAGPPRTHPVPLNHLQVELMRRHRQRREGDPGNERERMQRGVRISINGVAAGLRNTG